MEVLEDFKNVFGDSEILLEQTQPAATSEEANGLTP